MTYYKVFCKCVTCKGKPYSSSSDEVPVREFVTVVTVVFRTRREKAKFVVFLRGSVTGKTWTVRLVELPVEWPIALRVVVTSGSLSSSVSTAFCSFFFSSCLALFLASIFLFFSLVCFPPLFPLFLAVGGFCVSFCLSNTAATAMADDVAAAVAIAAREE